VISGAYDIVIAGGVEAMTRVPMGSSAKGPGAPLDLRWWSAIITALFTRVSVPT
jgi:acetyl-CoA acetyltransferase